MNPCGDNHTFFLLPLNISIDILLIWLTTKSIVQLDSALCNTYLRAKLHEIFQSEWFALHGKAWLSSKTIEQFTKWVIDRGTKIAELSLRVTPLETSTTLALFKSLEGSLRFLRIDRMISPEVLSDLCHYCGNLLHAELFQDEKRVDQFIKFLRVSQKKLVTLCVDIGENNFPFHYNYNNISLVSLKSLYLTGNLGNFNMKLINHCPHIELLTLRSFNLDTSINMLDSLFENEPENCCALRKIRCLVLTNPGKMDMSALSVFLQSCPKLEVFEVSGTNQVTDDFISKLVCSCPNLYAIRFGECQLMTDLSMRIIATHCSQKLRYFSIRSCWEITPSGLEAVTAACQGLLELAVQFQFKGDWREADLSSVLLNCRCIQSLGLASMHLTENSMLAISTTCSELTFLSVCGSDGSFLGGIDEVARKCRKLRHIGIYKREKKDFASRKSTWDRPDIDFEFDEISTPFWREYECSPEKVKYIEKKEEHSPFSLFSDLVGRPRC